MCWLVFMPAAIVPGTLGTALALYPVINGAPPLSSSCDFQAFAPGAPLAFSIPAYVEEHKFYASFKALPASGQSLAPFGLALTPQSWGYL